jgi:large subunit ribosomal protein L15
MSVEMLKRPYGCKKNTKRIGRGPGSGTGKTAGKGHKGQNARKGGGTRPGFEGGQTPLFRRLPKRGFKNARFKKEYNEVNLYMLDAFENGAVIDRDYLAAAGVKISGKKGIKVLGIGDLTKKLEVKADVFSKSAKEKIEKAGGKAVVLCECQEAKAE